MLAAGWTRSPNLKVLIGGEAVPRDLADQLVDRAGSVWNMYGPTETTVWSTVQPLAKNEPVFIGRPIANTQIYILDRGLNPVPTGVSGEIFIGGAGLARGYLNRPDLTSERFLPDPFSALPGARMYRTGDLGRFRSNGVVEYLGRNDFQVKLRGYRIELGEIETTMASHPSVRDAVVAAYEEAPGDQRLVGYLTVKGDAPPAFDELRTHLRASLPEYMVPAHFMVLEKLPLTANNKIDRKALPKPNRGATTTKATVQAEPREAVEFKLRTIWQEVLGLERVGIRDSFFDLGGHSLLALKLFDRIGAAFDIKLPIAALFEAPTIERLAELLKREGWKPSWSSLVPIQPSGTRPPFFCVHAVGGNVLNYRLLSRYVGNDQPFYGLQARGASGTEEPHRTVQEMATAYIQEIRSIQPHGPYFLGGSSSGGVIAYEMAQQLHAAGETVAELIFLDTAAVGIAHHRLKRAMSSSPLHFRGYLIDLHYGNLLFRRPREGLAYLAGRVRARLEGVATPIERTMKEANDLARHVFKANVEALDQYVPQPYPGRALMLLSSDIPERTAFDERLAWSDLVQGGLVVRFIPGDHENMLDEPVVADVGAVLRKCLDRSIERVPSERAPSERGPPNVARHRARSSRSSAIPVWTSSPSITKRPAIRPPRGSAPVTRLTSARNDASASLTSTMTTSEKSK